MHSTWDRSPFPLHRLLLRWTQRQAAGYCPPHTMCPLEATFSTLVPDKTIWRVPLATWIHGGFHNVSVKYFNDWLHVHRCTGGKMGRRFHFTTSHNLHCNIKERSSNLENTNSSWPTPPAYDWLVTAPEVLHSILLQELRTDTTENNVSIAHDVTAYAEMCLPSCCLETDCMTLLFHGCSTRTTQKTHLLLRVEPCLQSCCLATGWSNLLQYTNTIFYCRVEEINSYLHDYSYIERSKCYNYWVAKLTRRFILKTYLSNLPTFLRI
jgi:hypothetical protein